MKNIIITATGESVEQAQAPIDAGLTESMLVKKTTDYDCLKL